MDFGGVAQAELGSGMQLVVHAQRRAQMRGAEANANAEHERNIAQLVHRDLSSPKFWNTAGSEAIADRMIVASELAGRHEAASQAFMAGADRIRNQFGINVEDLNRDHPTAATDRHRALRDALDDYLAGQRAKTEQPPMGQEPWFAQPQGTFRDYDYNDGLERPVEISKQEVLRRLELMPADTVRDLSIGGRDTISFVPSWYGHDDEVDRAIAGKFPHLVPEGAKLPPERPLLARRRKPSRTRPRICGKLNELRVKNILTGSTLTPLKPRKRAHRPRRGLARRMRARWRWIGIVPRRNG